MTSEATTAAPLLRAVSTRRASAANASVVANRAAPCRSYSLRPSLARRNPSGASTSAGGVRGTAPPPGRNARLTKRSTSTCSSPGATGRRGTSRSTWRAKSLRVRVAFYSATRARASSASRSGLDAAANLPSATARRTAAGPLHRRLAAPHTGIVTQQVDGIAGQLALRGRRPVSGQEPPVSGHDNIERAEVGVTEAVPLKERPRPFPGQAAAPGERPGLGFPAVQSLTYRLTVRFAGRDPKVARSPSWARTAPLAGTPYRSRTSTKVHADRPVRSADGSARGRITRTVATSAERRPRRATSIKIARSRMPPTEFGSHESRRRCTSLAGIPAAYRCHANPRPVAPPWLTPAASNPSDTRTGATTAARRPAPSLTPP